MPELRPGRSVALDVDGPAAPPRANGELVFASPWEGRLFGVTLALHAAGRFEWEEFRRLLIEEIARADRRAQPPEAGSQDGYYTSWHAALERLLREKRLCAEEELAARSSELAARPAGHDHAPDHRTRDEQGDLT